jgi:hypothetical protein
MNMTPNRFASAPAAALPLKAIRGLRVACMLGAVALLLAGCSPYGQRAARVDPPRAHEALKTMLEGWKNGDTPAEIKSGSPSIVVQDFDWMSGHRLLAYEIDGDGKDDDANLRIPVKLTMQSPSGKELKKTVSYVVGTSPVLTVFREFGN